MKNRQTARQIARTKPRNKSHIDYWRKAVFHPTSLRDGKKYQSPNWMGAFSHKGHRESLSLETDNREAAAAKARDLFIFLKANDWPEWKKKFKPQSVKEVVAPQIATVAQYLDAAAPLFEGVCDPKTFHQYSQCLRRVGVDLTNLDPDLPDIPPRSKIGGKAWRKQAGQVALDIFTQDNITTWQNNYLKKAGPNQIRKLRAGSSANSILQQAKALFTEKVMARINLPLPDFVPFAKFERRMQSDTVFVPEVKIDQLALAARMELPVELYKIFILALLFGLRRREIDLLEWSAFDIDNAELRIKTTANFKPKTKKSSAVLPIDPDAVPLLAEWKAQASGMFVIESDAELKSDTVHYRLRCNGLFIQLNKWLREHGIVESVKPLHALRKAYGSAINEAYDIYVASTALRHSNIGTTVKHYVAKKLVSLPNAGALLNGPANIVPMEHQHTTKRHLVEKWARDSA